MSVLNAEPNERALEALVVRPNDHVLELGFGSGSAIARLARLTPHGIVDGIDHSARMLELARRRNRDAIRSGRVRLVPGSFRSLPYPDELFDKALLVNVAYFFSEDDHEIREIHRVLKPGGRAVIYVTDRTTMGRWAFARTGHHRLFDATDLQQLMAAKGFEPVRLIQYPLRYPIKVGGIIAIADKPS